MTVDARARSHDFVAVLERHGADLSRLRGGRGVIPCVFPGHDDRRASLSVDVDRAVFHCFGCGQAGGFLQLRALLGGAGSSPAPRDTGRPTPTRRAIPPERQADILAWWRANARIRRARQTADSLRTLATAWGRFTVGCWPTLDGAARLEREAGSLEAELDLLLSDGRV